MVFLTVILDLCFFGAIFYMLYHDHKLKKSDSTEKPLKKKWQYWAFVLVTFFGTGMAASFSDTEYTNNESATYQSKRDSESSANGDDTDSTVQKDDTQTDTEDTDSDDSENQVDEKEVNKNISMLLKDDQKDATNGDDRYAYALYLKKIKYGDESVDIQVASNFFDLSSKQKDVVAERVQGVVGAGLSMVDSDYKPKDDQEGYNLNFHYGQIAVGHSKMWNSHKYKWYKSAG